eukprot:6181854-Pleurochrysis_carterae.AAC.1
MQPHCVIVSIINNVNHKQHLGSNILYQIEGLACTDIEELLARVAFFTAWRGSEPPPLTYLGAQRPSPQQRRFRCVRSLAEAPRLMHGALRAVPFCTSARGCHLLAPRPFLSSMAPRA